MTFVFIGLYCLDMNLMNLKHLQNMYKLNARFYYFYHGIFFHRTYMCFKCMTFVFKQNELMEKKKNYN
jgi:hypothetical protein